MKCVSAGVSVVPARTEREGEFPLFVRSTWKAIAALDYRYDARSVTIASRTASGFPRITRSTAACSNSIFSAAVTARASESAVRRFLMTLYAFYMYLRDMTTQTFAGRRMTRLAGL